MLLEAKAQLEHGEWLGWVQPNFHLKKRTARRYMQLVEADFSKVARAPHSLSSVTHPDRDPSHRPAPPPWQAPVQRVVERVKTGAGGRSEEGPAYPRLARRAKSVRLGVSSPYPLVRNPRLRTRCLLVFEQDGCGTVLLDDVPVLSGDLRQVELHAPPRELESSFESSKVDYLVETRTWPVRPRPEDRPDVAWVSNFSRPPVGANDAGHDEQDRDEGPARKPDLCAQGTPYD